MKRTYIFKLVNAEGKQLMVPSGEYSTTLIRIIHHRGKRRGEVTLVYQLNYYYGAQLRGRR